tara:strand:- start:550 stop:744 length:195 start_codon:yes stop_codon:yes gene_type:complete
MRAVEAGCFGMTKKTAMKLAGTVLHENDPWHKNIRQRCRENIANPPSGYSYRFKGGSWHLVKNS